MSASVQPVGSDVTVNEGLLPGWALTVTTKGPDVAPAGTATKRLVSLQFTTATLMPFNETVLSLGTEPKPVPEIVT